MEVGGRMQQIAASILRTVRRLSLVRALAAAAGVALLVGGVALAAVPGGSTAGFVRASVYPGCAGGSVHGTVYSPNCLRGIVTDAATHHPIAGASVTLQRCSTTCTTVPAGDPAISPNHNPLFTDAGGHYEWNVGNGHYRLVVAKGGYVSKTTASFGVPPTTGVNLALSKSQPNGNGNGTGTGTGNGNNGGHHPAGKCAGLKGKKHSACVRKQKLKRALARCNRFDGKKRAACRKRAKALARCDKKKGKKRAKCRQRAKHPGHRH
jgi:hypothetical protein